MFVFNFSIVRRAFHCLRENAGTQTTKTKKQILTTFSRNHFFLVQLAPTHLHDSLVMFFFHCGSCVEYCAIEVPDVGWSRIFRSRISFPPPPPPPPLTLSHTKYVWLLRLSAVSRIVFVLCVRCFRILSSQTCIRFPFHCVLFFFFSIVLPLFGTYKLGYRVLLVHANRKQFTNFSSMQRWHVRFVQFWSYRHLYSACCIRQWRRFRFCCRQPKTKPIVRHHRLDIFVYLFLFVRDSHSPADLLLLTFSMVDLCVFYRVVGERKFMETANRCFMFGYYFSADPLWDTQQLHRAQHALCTLSLAAWKYTFMQIVCQQKCNERKKKKKSVFNLIFRANIFYSFSSLIYEYTKHPPVDIYCTEVNCIIMHIVCACASWLHAFLVSAIKWSDRAIVHECNEKKMKFVQRKHFVVVAGVDGDIGGSCDEVGVGT